ncbi:Gfo/Idh/MocA family oxidoreductase [Bacillus sp. A301a_S52]|nr:Gfo/Idh/MocA family oxidoreductase [Bacillus sp. A301a_S52]
MVLVQLKFAIIGCGRIAKKHVASLMELNDTQIVSVCDLQRDRARKYGEKLGVPYYTNYHDMLKNEQIDIVCVLTPSGLHAKHTIDIAENYQKHIVCEKPMALQLKDADEMINVCEKNNVRLFIVLQNRFNLAVQKLQKALENDRFGKLVLGTVRVRWSRPQSYYDSDMWRGTWELDGGCITNQASHHIDLLQWMLGEPVEVTAKTATRLLNIEVEDTGVAIIKFRNGALGVIEVTTATRPNDLEGSISILGEKGSVEIGGLAVNEIKIWQFEGQFNQDDALLANEYPENVYGFGHKKYLSHVVDCILNHQPSMFDGVEGRKSLEIIHAIYESVATENNVHLKFEPKKSKLGVSNEKH